MSLSNFKKEKIQGFVYSSDEENELFKNVKVGDSIIKKDKQPPYIVVDHSLDTKIITQWPGKLYKVEIINQSKEKSINKGLVKNVWYTRTLGVKIIKEVPIESLFGANGQKISRIIDLTRNITEQQVNAFSKYNEESNRDLFTKTWKNWIMLTDKENVYLNDDHYNTLEISPKNQRYNSPIKDGLSIISSQFDIRARELVGEIAFGVDEEGERYLQPVWAKASEKLRQAGISYAEDNILTESERNKLRNPVMEVFDLEEKTLANKMYKT